MMHLAVVVDKYLQRICKRAGDEVILPNQDGIIDLYYIQELASQFLNARESDVNVAECWQIDAIFDSLAQYEDLCFKREHQGY